MTDEKKFLTSLDGYAVYSSDKIYCIKNKSIITVKDIYVSEKFNQVWFIVEEQKEPIFINDCCIMNDLISNPDSVHIDDYIDSFTGLTDKSQSDIDMENYTKFFFMLHRLPAWMMHEFEEWINQYKLFCVYKGKKYRITGGSSMGDIWLNKNFKETHGYNLRVMINEVSDFTKE